MSKECSMGLNLSNTLYYPISHFPCVWFKTTLLKVSDYYHISKGFYKPLKRPSGPKTTNNN